MDTFNFPAHLVSTKEPANSFRMSFGGAYVFTAAPDAPDQRVFTLYFTGMQYYQNSDGSIDSTTNAAINNMAALYTFYKAHKLHITFIYPHPIFGNITVKFKDPLEVPKGIRGGTGVVEDFQMTMEEAP
jgi:hypothetical protein